MKPLLDVPNSFKGSKWVKLQLRFNDNWMVLINTLM